MNLYELTEAEIQIRALLESLTEMPDVADTEAVTTLTEALLTNRDHLEYKAEAYAKIYSMLDAEAKTLDEEAKKFADRAKIKKNEADRLKRSMHLALTALETDELKAGLFKWTIQKNGGVQPLHVDEDATVDRLPERFVKIVKQIDNAAIRQALELGEELPFARLNERGKSLRLKLA